MSLAHVRGVFTCLLLLLSANPALAQIERFIEGVHYTRLPDPAAAYGQGAVEGQPSVLEVFWYGCGHCYAFDPLLNTWVAGKDASIHFARTPAIWDATTKQHARLFFAVQTLGLQERMHNRIFDEIHQKQNFLLDEAAIIALFGEFGIEQSEASRTLASFGVDLDVRRTAALQSGMAIPSVPALIINGTWMINSTDVLPTHQDMLDVADFLLAKSS